MRDWSQPKITSYGSKGKRGQYDLEKLPPAAHISYKPEMVGERYGWVKIISSEKRWSEAWNHCYVLTKCTGCGSVQWQNLHNLRSKGCQRCSQPRQIPLWLDKRLAAAKGRCENSRDAQYQRYGARGIRFEFRSVTEAGLYLIGIYGVPARKMEIDRIDTNGNYARGNLRFVTRAQNASNRRNTVITRFDQRYWPYCQNVVTRKLSAGESRTEIIQDAKKAVLKTRKHWGLIEARLEFMTYEMPADIIVLPYRAS